MKLETRALKLETPLLVLAGACALAAVFGFAFTPVAMSQDEWWHLKAGKWIWEHGLRPPRHDIFAYTSAEYPWDNHEWLAQAAMYGAYALGEATGFGPMRAVITAKTLALLAAFALVAAFAWRRSSSWGLALLFAVLAAAVGRHTMQPRPSVLTYLFLAAFQWALWAHHAGRLRGRWLFLLPPATALWANLHGGFILGEIAIACYFVGELAEWGWLRIFRRSQEGGTPYSPCLQRAKTLLAVGALCGLCSLATPFGWRLYLLPQRVMSDENLVKMIWELQPPALRQAPEYVALFSFVAIAGALCWRRLFVGEVLWIAFLFLQSFYHQRHLPLFAIAAAPLAAELPLRPEGRTPNLLEIAALTVAAAFSLWRLTHHPRDEQGRLCASYLDRAGELLKGRAYRIDDYPVRLCDFIEDAGFRGRMFNDSRYAGYLIWRFSPETHQVFTDMRYDIFGGDFLPEEMAVRRGVVTLLHHDGATRQMDWREVFQRWKINFAVLDKLEGRDSPRPVIPELEASGQWTLVYQDPGDRGLVVYLKNTPENADILERCRALAPDCLYTRPGHEPWGR
ncbi:MAG: hypothetical protein NTW86_22925 [Candidatus Sumerlaeota bacterium]|nr:hypothetical protein [Candidatus Sumerlaeota bacterium]